jgi:FAD/FMN-containing dehydrogenase
VTANHVLGLELVLGDGEIVLTGSFADPGYDLTGLMKGGRDCVSSVGKNQADRPGRRDP